MLKGFVLLDGAMGTQLEANGLSMGGQNCLSNPETVLKIYREYVEAGSEAITTNTLTMNRVFIEKHRLNVEVGEVNIAGARLAKQAAVKGVNVLGNIGSTGQLLAPDGDYTESDFYSAFREQVKALVKGGVDAFILETFFDIREALCALKACKKSSRKPVTVTMAFNTVADGGRTLMGNSAEEVAKVLTKNGANAVGLNCGDIDPFEMAELVPIFRENTGLPIAVQPNAGKPQLVDGRSVFDLDPKRFSEGLAKCIENGANIVGGCCGTTPAHIKETSGLDYSQDPGVVGERGMGPVLF